MSRRNLAVLLTACLLSAVCYVRNSPDPHARYVADAYEDIDRLALFEPGDDALVAGAMRGMVDTLRERGDEHSGYSDPRESQRFLADIRQEFGGVGIRIRFEGEPPRLMLVGPPEPNTPASRAGLLPGDYVDAIDGRLTSELLREAAAAVGVSLDAKLPTGELSDAEAEAAAINRLRATRAAMEQVLDLMRGPTGETVVLTLTRGEGPDAIELTAPLVRAEIEVPSVLGDRRLPTGEWDFQLEGCPQIALLRITSFGNKTLRELHEVLPALLTDGVRAIVFDLRGNPGGALDVVIDICNLLLPKNALIVETRGRNKRQLSSYRASGGPFTELPLAVLIDGDSASAAEIMAACLQDNGRAVVIGARSYGKGTVQQILRMESGRTLLKLTTASYWRPSGENIHRMPGDSEQVAWGVRPDEGFEVLLTDEERAEWIAARSQRDTTVVTAQDGSEGEPEPPSDATQWRDVVLQRAIEHLLSELGDG